MFEVHIRSRRKGFAVGLPLFRLGGLHHELGDLLFRHFLRYPYPLSLIPQTGASGRPNPTMWIPAMSTPSVVSHISLGVASAGAKAPSINVARPLGRLTPNVTTEQYLAAFDLKTLGNLFDIELLKGVGPLNRPARGQASAARSASADEDHWRE